MPPRRKRRPSPHYEADLASCVAANLHTIAGLMQQRGVRIVRARTQTDHGVPFAAIVVQGKENADALAEVGKRIAAAIDADTERRRIIAERG